MHEEDTPLCTKVFLSRGAFKKVLPATRVCHSALYQVAFSRLMSFLCVKSFVNNNGCFYLRSYTPSGHQWHSFWSEVSHETPCADAGMTSPEQCQWQRTVCKEGEKAVLPVCPMSNIGSIWKHNLARQRGGQEIQEYHLNHQQEGISHLKPQLMGMSSFSRTSDRLPLGQYSVMMLTYGTSMEPPINLHRLGWSSCLCPIKERTQEGVNS